MTTSRRLLSATSLAIAAGFTALACSDGLLGPTRDRQIAQLGIRPSFETLDGVGANPALLLDNVQLRFERLDGMVALDTIIVWPLDAAELDVVVRVRLTAETETFQYLLTARAGDVVLFQAGPQALRLTAGRDTTVEAGSLTYVGPGADAAGLVVAGAPAWLAPGDTVRLAASAFDAQEQPIPGAPVRWLSLDTLAARVDGTGLVTAAAVSGRNAGIVALIAFTTVNDTVHFPVGAASVSVTPGAAALDALGDTVTLRAVARGPLGDTIQDAAFAWSVTGEAVSVLATSDGDVVQVVAVANGAATVRAAWEARCRGPPPATRRR
jgi:hypothetical protein